MAEILILGGGISGISAAWHAQKAGHEAVIFEAGERWGGLLDHFYLDGFRFDKAVHFGFSNNDDYLAVLEKTEYYTHRPESFNYESGLWLKHPVQNNLFPLPVDEKIEAIKSFIARPDQGADSNYAEWLEEQFGSVIANRYPARYTKKYWTIEADEMSTEWIGNRLYRPTLDEVLLGAMTDRTPDTYYLPEFFYPKRGGYRAFLEPLIPGLNISTAKRAVRINPQKKYVDFDNGAREYYDYLVSSVPLPELAEMIEGVPKVILEEAGKLWATSIALVSLGFNRPEVSENLWFYIYDSDILPARAHAPYRKSPDNAPAGYSSLQFEIYYSRHQPLELSGDLLVEHVLDVVEKMKLAERKDVVVADCRILPYGNVVFDIGMVERRDFVLEQINTYGILPVGRFGEWDYLWADQCFLSGKKVERMID